MLSLSLRSAAVDGDRERLRKLLNKVGHHEKDEEGFTPLHYAAWAGDLSLTETLVKKSSANINAKNSSGKTPLHLACSEARLETAMFLIDSGAQINAKDNIGYTPLHVAAEASWGVTGWEGSGGKERPLPELCSMLLKRGADPSARDVFGRTPLDVSTANEQVREMLRIAIAQSNPLFFSSPFH